MKSELRYISVTLIILLFLVSSSVDAFIFREYKLEEVVEVCSNVVFGKVTSIDQKKMSFKIDQIEDIKGEGSFRDMKISLVLGRKNHSGRLMGKLRSDIPVVIFYIPIGENRLEALGYVLNTWIRLFAVQNNSESFRWYFTHIEKYMSRTFDGEVMKLQRRIREICPSDGQPDPIDIESFVRRRYTLDEMVRACRNIVYGRISSIDAKNIYIGIDRIENIKGECQAEKMKVSFAMGHADSAKQLISRLHKDTDLVILYVPMNHKRIDALGYIGDTWIRLFAIPDNSKSLEWYFAHIEKYMNHIFDGKTSKLKSQIREIITNEKTAYVE